MAGALGTFGVGLLVGAGVALMLAPKPGRELRGDIRRRLRSAPDDVRDAVSSAVGHESSATKRPTQSKDLGPGTWTWTRSRRG